MLLLILVRLVPCWVTRRGRPDHVEWLLHVGLVVTTHGVVPLAPTSTTSGGLARTGATRVVASITTSPPMPFHRLAPVDAFEHDEGTTARYPDRRIVIAELSQFGLLDRVVVGSIKRRAEAPRGEIGEGQGSRAGLTDDAPEGGEAGSEVTAELIEPGFPRPPPSSITDRCSTTTVIDQFYSARWRPAPGPFDYVVGGVPPL
ncbi:hypothetical protein P4132_22505 [Pseudomonas aeruginosa]|nr:hypothetical protein [Pseudomonas aeruginosa]